METKLEGYDAIEAAEACGDLVMLHKYADPIEGPRVLTLEEAREVAAVDPALIWCLVEY